MISASVGDAAAAPLTFLHHQVFMGRPDRPGDDDREGNN
jgi:hypothetical protein